MDKQKQIEDVRQDLEDIDGTDGIHILGYIPLAKNLIEKGYRKIPELPKDTVLTGDDIAELLTIVAKDTRKETAEKFAESFKQRMKDKYQGSGIWWTEIVLMAIEICKEITEGKV